MARTARVATIGHVEWTEFAPVERVPAAGEVAHAGEPFSEPAGGGAVVAVQLARLAGESTFFTALGRDGHGMRSQERLEQLGVRVHVAWRDRPTRRALTLVDDGGERTIITLGQRLAPEREDELPWEQLSDMDAVYFTAGGRGAMRAARGARVLVATPRARDALHGGVRLDALVLSQDDPDERREAETLSQPPALVVHTEGAGGGSYVRADGSDGRWTAAPLPGQRQDSYGCGDSFAAGFTFGLGAGMGADEALELAARCGAACLTGRGPYGRQLTGREV
jgi:ribokinase